MVSVAATLATPEKSLVASLHQLSQSVLLLLPKQLALQYVEVVGFVYKKDHDRRDCFSELPRRFYGFFPVEPYSLLDGES